MCTLVPSPFLNFGTANSKGDGKGLHYKQSLFPPFALRRFDFLADILLLTRGTKLGKRTVRSVEKERRYLLILQERSLFYQEKSD